MECKDCGSKRVAEVDGKTSDMCFVSMGEKEHDGYVPSGMNIGEGDYIRFSYCLNCGQIQGDFPVSPCSLEDEHE